MTRLERDLEHWERLWYGGHADREQVREAMRQLGADESHILHVLGPEPLEETVEAA